MDKHTEVKVARLPLCDIDSTHGPAAYDGKTHGGPWGNMCEPCFAEYGIGLGLGKGQKLILIEDKKGEA